MSSANSSATIYYIPDNFIDEPRIFQGIVKRRYFLEGLILGLLGVPLSFLFKVTEVSTRVGLTVTSMLPGMLIGLVGFNGDPISVALLYIRDWMKNKSLELYNSKPRILSSAPSDDIIDVDTMGDKVVDLWDKFQQKRIEKHENAEYVEGETFEFKSDPWVDDYAGQPMTEEDYQEYLKQLEAEMEDDGEVRIVSKTNLGDLDDIDMLDADTDYSVETPM